MTILRPARPAVLPRRWRITASKAEQMLRSGILQEDDHVELLDGDLYEQPPATDWENAGVSALIHALMGGEALVHIRGWIRLDELSAPEPDIALLAFRAAYYRDGGAGPEDVLLVVEVSDSTVKFDREVKLPLYARAGIPEVWIVTREPAVIEAYRSPRDGTYTEMRTYLRDELASPIAFPDLKIPVIDVTG